MAKRGKKPRPITKQDISQAKKLAQVGCTDEQIFNALGVSRNYFYQKIKENDDFNDAIKQGRAQGVAMIANRHFEAALNGNIKAQQFFLSRRGGFHETTQLQALDGNGEKANWTVEFVNADPELQKQR